MGGERIPVSLSIKYLGLVLDGRVNFDAHFAQPAPRVEKVALSRIMPNMGGPRERVRRLYASVTQSMLLYGPPRGCGLVCHNTLGCSTGLAIPGCPSSKHTVSLWSRFAGPGDLP